MSEQRRLWVLDGQVLQTQARLRGMGQYSFELICALSDEPGYDVRVVLNDALDVEPVRADLARRAPSVRIDVVDLKLDTPGDPVPRRHNIGVLDDYLRTLDRPADFLLMSAMQGTIVPVLPAVAGVRKWTLVYDLIPLMFPDLYLTAPLARREYESRLVNITGADGVFAISRTVANDITRYLGIEAERIVTINGAPVSHAADGTSAGGTPVPGVREPFILMPTGNDARKNNDRAIRAFARFSEEHQQYSLVVTSTFTPEDIERLSAFSDRVVFTGVVTGEQMAYLYRHARAVFFPPEYEGLGLPLLEAFEYNAPVACSDIAVFREIAEVGPHYFDPESISEMVLALAEATAGAPASSREQDVRADALARYSWAAVRASFVDGVAAASTTIDDERAAWDEVERPRMQVVSAEPVPGRWSDALVLDIHAALARRVDVRYLFDRSGLWPHERGHVSRALQAVRLRPGVSLDNERASIFVLGPDARYALTYLHALAHRGVVVLTDIDLTAPWEQCRAQGLVSASRERVEERLQAREPEGVVHVAGLLAAARAVIVLRPDHGQLLTALADALGLDTPVLVRPYPLAQLPHPELMATKISASVHVPVPDTAARANSYFRAAAAVGRTAVAVLNHPEPGPVIHAMRSGAVPCTPCAPAALGLAEDCVLTADPDDADSAVAALLADPDGYEAAVRAGRRELAEHHDPADFVDFLVTLVSTPGPT